MTWLVGRIPLSCRHNAYVSMGYEFSSIAARMIHPVAGAALYTRLDVKGPQTVAFNLPNDERIVKDRGSSMVMLKNVSEAK
ncbi:nudix hydrolase 3 [Artemisia annua]|uniref:Nudix hydrolase 3 n=1 Tax=Artemisia annua TaxID=35608 RepID=A0A2U1Q6H7_ARTAN|nr:nudix hydrolase 3 [Artemisia annua]